MILGLTGGIGTGKTTVLNFFKELGANVFIADLEAKELMNTNVELIDQIKQLFGSKAYDNGKLNRTFIANLVFNNPQNLKRLNKIVHPKVQEKFKNDVKNFPNSIVIYEAAILFESESYKLCDFIVTVTANLDERINRVIVRDNTTKEKILLRMNNQLPDEAKIKRSHFVINNSSLNYTKEQVKTIYSLLVKLKTN
jgi:dephospho-CoA kinase